MIGVKGTGLRCKGVCGEGLLLGPLVFFVPCAWDPGEGRSPDLRGDTTPVP